MIVWVGLAFAGGPEVGQPAPDFTLPDLDGNVVALSAMRGKTVVLEWFNPGCPYVKYAHGEGPLTDLAARQAGDDVVWLAVNSSAPGKQGHGVELNRTAAMEWKMSHPILLDEDGVVGHAYGARTTPQMFVIGPQGNVAYVGALDNDPMGQERKKNPNIYVVSALEAMSAGRNVPTPETKPYGCSVKY